MACTATPERGGSSARGRARRTTTNGDNVTDVTLKTLTLPLGDKRQLVLGLTHDVHGASVDICVACGPTDEPALDVLASGVALESSALPELAAALGELGAV